MKENTENDIELTSTGNNNESKGRSEVIEQVSVTFCERLRRIVTSLTVEPFLFCYILSSAIGYPGVKQIHLEKACRTVMNYNETFCLDIVRVTNDDNETVVARSNVSSIVSVSTSWQQPLESGIPGILILFVGAWSDRTGNRKALLLCPAAGEIIGLFGLLLNTYYMDELPFVVTALTVSLPTALSGGISIAIMGSFSILADVTSEESRTFRLGMLGILTNVGITVGSAVSGIVFQEMGYYGTFTFQIFIQAIGLIYVYYKVNDIKKDQTDGTCLTKLTTFFNPYNLWDTISLVIVIPWRQRKRLLLVLCAHVLVLGPVRGEEAVSYEYALVKYGMTPLDNSFYNTYKIVIGLVGTTVAMLLFNKYLKMNDCFIGIIAVCSKILYALMSGWAPNWQWYLSGPALDLFGGAALTITRSLGTKIVDTDKVGKMCSLIGLLESLLPIAYVPLFTNIYNSTVNVFPSAFFWVGGIMTVPAVFVFIVIYYMNRREERDTVKDPKAKEMHAHDNDVTAL